MRVSFRSVSHLFSVTALGTPASETTSSKWLLWGTAWNTHVPPSSCGCTLCRETWRVTASVELMKPRVQMGGCQEHLPGLSTLVYLQLRPTVIAMEPRSATESTLAQPETPSRGSTSVRPSCRQPRSGHLCSRSPGSSFPLALPVLSPTEMSPRGVPQGQYSLKVTCSTFACTTAPAYRPRNTQQGAWRLGHVRPPPLPSTKARERMPRRAALREGGGQRPDEGEGCCTKPLQRHFLVCTAAGSRSGSATAKTLDLTGHAPGHPAQLQVRP